MQDVKDPLISEDGVKAKTANYSEFMAKKVKLAAKGINPNACPFGCESHELDARGYCHHLVGFTHEDEPLRKKAFEVLMTPDPDDRLRRRSVDGSRIEKIQRTDVLVRITNNYRVYRPTGIESLLEDRATRPDETKKPAAPTA